nr:hypothetical protein [Candidatus Hydrogenedentota bacterium]
PMFERYLTTPASGSSSGATFPAVPTPDGPGHQFRRVYGEGIQTATPGCIMFKYWNSGISATVEFCEKSTITFLVRNSTGAGRDVCAGYCTASPAKKYYQAPYWEVTNPTTWAYRNAEWVACTAHPRPGYTFVRWKGEGVAWIADWSNPNDPPPPAYPLDAPDEEVLAVDESGNLVPHVNRPTIYIRTAQKDANQEGGPAHRNLTAFFTGEHMPAAFGFDDPDTVPGTCFPLGYGGGYLAMTCLWDSSSGYCPDLDRRGALHACGCGDPRAVGQER